MSTTAHDPDEPPAVQRLIISGIENGGTALRTTLRSIDQGILVWCWGIGTVAIFCYVLIGSIVTSPSIFEGILKGVFGGVFIALLFAVAFGSLMLWARREPKNVAPDISTRAGELDARLQPALRELTALRKDIIQQVKTRSITRVPLGTVGGVVAWFLARQGNDPPGMPELLLFAIIGAVAGEYWAWSTLAKRYRRRYKDQVLHKLPRSSAASPTARHRETTFGAWERCESFPITTVSSATTRFTASTMVCLSALPNCGCAAGRTSEPSWCLTACSSVSRCLAVSPERPSS